MADSSRSQTTVSRSSARALTRPKVIFALTGALALFLSLLPSSANAHLPVRLGESAKKLSSAPIIVDGTVSFAVYAEFSALETKKSTATSFIRFNHQAGDDLAVQYLIPDTAQMRKMKKSDLPKVVITSPSGAITRLTLDERTRFSKPYLPQDYFYLSRVSALAESGIYSVRVRAKSAASVLVAIGAKEIPGEVLQFGASAGLCPLPIGVPNETPVAKNEPIEQSRANQLVGMPEEKAKLCADSNKWGYRVGERDGEFFALTRDYRIDRITVSITKGIITRVDVG
jgi:hypothetical protein